MSARALLQSLTARGVNLSANDGKLVYDAPPGVLTDADRATLRDRKPELLAVLSSPASDAANSQVPRRRRPKEQFSHDPLPIMGCPACSGRRWRLRSTPQTGGEWLWACAACADAVQIATAPAPPR